MDEGAPAGKPGDKLILIVDDDPLIRDLLELTITSAGFKVVLAVNGHDAAGKLDTMTPNLIITDLMMPGQGGYEFIRALGGAGAGSTPVFVVSASALDKSTIGMIKQEANVMEFFSKPIKMNALILALHKYLGTAPSADASTSRGLNDR